MNELLERFPLLGEMFGYLSTAALHFLAAVLVAFLGWIIARILARLIRKLLRKAQFDRFSDRLNGIELLERYNLKFRASHLISGAVYYLVLFIFLVAAADLLRMHAVSSLVSALIHYIPDLIAAILVFVFGVLFADFLRKGVHNLFKSMKVPSAKLISDVLFYFMLVNVLIIALTQADVKTDFIEGNLFIILGGVMLSFAIGYGLASKDMVSNFLSALYNRDKLQVGDVITIDGTKGEIVYMDHISFVLKDGDDQVVLPLSRLTHHKFTVHKAVKN